MSDGVRLLSNEEITTLASAIFKDWRIKLLLQAFPIVVLAGVAAAALFLNWSAAKRLKTVTAEIEQTSSEEVAQALTTATNQLAYQFRLFANDASNRVIAAYSTVTNQIAEEFQTPRIKRVVENVAQGEAKSILEAEVKPAVTSFKEDSLFIRTIARAQVYDFKAYQGLLEIGKGTDENAQIANQVTIEIDRSLIRDRSAFSPKRTFMIFSGTNFYSGPFTSDEIAMRFSASAKDRTSFNREAFVNAVADMKQPLFLASLIEFFTNETDLAVADRLTVAISDLAKEDFHPRDIEKIQTWWAYHQNEYTNWPVLYLEVGWIEFLAGRYSKALEAFQKVLGIDPSADQSRALAIACSLETGKANSAIELAKGFNQPEARWALWGKAFLELHTGSVSNATVQFADLKKNQSTMVLLPVEGASLWNKIDWTLFHKLVSSGQQ